MRVKHGSTERVEGQLRTQSRCPHTVLASPGLAASPQNPEMLGGKLRLGKGSQFARGHTQLEQWAKREKLGQRDGSAV